MKRFGPTLPCLLAAIFSSLAFAFDPSASVKVTPLLTTSHTWDGGRIVYPEGQAEVTVMVIEIAPGGETGWHSHGVPSFGMVLEGELEVSLITGETMLLKAGDAAAEVVDTVHNGRNVGTTPVKLVVMYAGAEGSVLTRAESSDR